MNQTLAIGVFIGLCISVFSLNPQAWIFTGLVFGLYGKWFLKPQVYPVALLAFVFPLLEISTSLINVELSGLTLNEGFGSSGFKAYALSLSAFVLFMLGFRLSAPKEMLKSSPNDVLPWLRSIEMKKLIAVHVFLYLIYWILSVTFRHGSSLFQLVLHFDKFHLVILYLIGWKYAVEKKHGVVVMTVFLTNLVLRLGSFFSDWTELLFLLVFVQMVVTESFDSKWFRRMSLVAMLGLGAIATWQAIKVDYRAFLNGGTRSQAVVVSWTEALPKFGEMSQSFWKGEDQNKSNETVLESTLDRIGYLRFFALTVERVPSAISHTQGQLMADNISFAVIPRLLDPDKGIKDDQWKVERYAGILIADNASFSLGRYAEWYVDFGSAGVWLFAMIFGMLSGFIPRCFGQRGDPKDLAVTMIYLCLLLPTFVSFQFDEIVCIGQTFWGIVVFSLFGRKLINRLLSLTALK